MPDVTGELIQRARRAQPLDVHQRAERLLKLIGKESLAIGDSVILMNENARMADIDSRAMAWSESTTLSEVQFLVEYLLSQGWIQRQDNLLTDLVGDVCYTVTVDGYRRIGDTKTNTVSTQVFVAMWFDEDMKVAYTQGIEPAIKNAGYKPMRIDQKPDVNKIDDEIIAEIRRSRFLVADFTQGEDGARGGVYFEAGFALGLGIPVIYTCREDAIDKIHFDTRQYHHIRWRNPEDLRNELEKRILARIGEGPGVSSGSQAR